MASLADIGVSAFINILTAFAFLLAFALLRIQPINDRVYFSKWYAVGKRSGRRNGGGLGRFVNLDLKTYLTFLNWMPQALRMSEAEIINHAGLDSAVFLRIYILGLKIFGPIAILALLVLIPVNTSGGALFFLERDLVVSDIDRLSISNVRSKSYKFFVHISLEYLFTIWACCMLYVEYGRVAAMRFSFLASQGRRPEQFTVLVKGVPRAAPGGGSSVSDTVEKFFRRNHAEHYLCHQGVYYAKKFAGVVKKRNKLQNWLDYNQLKLERNPGKRPSRRRGFLGLWGERVDTIDFYKEQIEDLQRKAGIERERAMNDSKSVSPAAFVSFDSRWGAAVCAQTQQSRNPTAWLTDWAPEPRDVYWKNLGIPFLSITVRKVAVSVAMFALVFFYMVPIALVQSLANLDGLERVAPFLRPVVERKVVKSFLQGFLPGLALKIFLLVLPAILMIMSKVEGHVARSVLERRAASKYYYFMLVNVFLGSIVTGTAFEQLSAFVHQPPAQIPINIGVSIPMKATFFITYVMVDGWAGIAGEILRLKQLVIFHLKSAFLIRTERDLDRATVPKSIDVVESLPQAELYFLLGVVYMAVTPILLPFILVFFGLAYFVYRHQVINVYGQRYESSAGFWPHVQTRIVASLIISQLLLMGLLSTKKAAKSTPLLILLPILTFVFHRYCKNRFEGAFRKYPIEEAVNKDVEEDGGGGRDPAYLREAYLHPVFRTDEDL